MINLVYVAYMLYSNLSSSAAHRRPRNTGEAGGCFVEVMVEKRGSGEICAWESPRENLSCPVKVTQGLLSMKLEERKN